MALTADMMIQRSRHPVDDFHTTSWQLDGEDIKIDHYLSMYYSDLTPQDDKRRCDLHWMQRFLPCSLPILWPTLSISAIHAKIKALTSLDTTSKEVCIACPAVVKQVRR